MPIELTKQTLNIGIVTSQGERATAFYRDVFGLSPMDDLRLPGVGVIHRLSCGECVLRILVPEEKPDGDASEGGLSGRPGYRYLMFEVVDVRAAVAAVEAGGGSIVLAPLEPRPGRWVAQVRDPDGNLVEVAQGG